MEVHHHPHVEKKDFKEYFLEFLMIFLAVTMGFFAENIREHFAEEKTTREYLESFQQELQHNKATFHYFDSLYTLIIPVQDSAVNLFFTKHENDDLKATSALLISIAVLALPPIDASAYQQLVNSGGLRYIHNTALKDSMSDYAGQIEYFHTYNSTVAAANSAMQSQAAYLRDVHDVKSRAKIPDIMPYPALTERERRLLVSLYRATYLQSAGNQIMLRHLSGSNDALLRMIDKELDD